MTRITQCLPAFLMSSSKPIDKCVYEWLCVNVIPCISWTGLSGVYNITDHYEHQKRRAVEYVSAMHKAMNGVENFPFYSPSHLLRTLSQDQLNRCHRATAGLWTVMTFKSFSTVSVWIGLSSSGFPFFQGASIHFAPWDQWCYRSCWIIHQIKRAPQLSICEGVTLLVAETRPQSGCQRPDGVRQALLPHHLQLCQTGVQKNDGNRLMTSDHLHKKKKG